jgi:hypothetical protein
MTPLYYVPNFSIVFDQVTFTGECRKGVLVSATVTGQPNIIYNYIFTVKSLDAGYVIIEPLNGQFAMSNNSNKIFATVYTDKFVPFVISCRVSDDVNAVEAVTTIVCQT